MSNPTNLTLPAVEPQKFNVLMMTAVVVSVTAQSEAEAAFRALNEAPSALDATRMRWVVKLISDKEIAIEDPEIAEVAADVLGAPLEIVTDDQ